jgi:hypothetical protein
VTPILLDELTGLSDAVASAHFLQSAVAIAGASPHSKGVLPCKPSY